jgi:hypothetical protein
MLNGCVSFLLQLFGQTGAAAKAASRHNGGVVHKPSFCGRSGHEAQAEAPKIVLSSAAGKENFSPVSACTAGTPKPASVLTTVSHTGAVEASQSAAPAKKEVATMEHPGSGTGAVVHDLVF